MKTQNIYMIIIISAILFLLLDFVLSKIHFKVEKFANQPSISPTPSSEPIEDNLFDKLNNKELTIKDFYPQIKKPLDLGTKKQMIFKHKLFHQILPKFGDGYLGLV